MKKILLVFICSLFFVSYSFAYETNKTEKDSYYEKTKNVYYMLYTGEWINENQYESLRKKAWIYIYKANSQPKKIYTTALSQKKIIEEKVRDSYYGKIKKIYSTLWQQGYISESVFEELRSEAAKSIYEENSQPKKIYNLALEYQKRFSQGSQNYFNDTLGIKFSIPSPNKVILENNSSILVGDDNMTYFSITVSKDKKRLGNGVYTYASKFQKALKNDEKSFSGDLEYAVGELSKVKMGGLDGYGVEQNFTNTKYTKWFFFVEHKGYFFQIETDSRFGDTMSLSNSFTFY